MSWPYSMLIVEATGNTLAAADYNNEHQNHINNNIPTSIDDLSTTLADMRVQTNPYPSSSPSQATDLATEVQQLRYQLSLIIANGGYWYVTPAQNLLTLSTHRHTGGTDCPVLNGGTAITAATITGDRLVNNTITATQIANTTITATQIANATITTTQISGSAGITGSQLASATVALSNLTSGVTKLLSPLETVAPVTTTNTTDPTTWTYNVAGGRLLSVTVHSSAGATDTLTLKVDGTTVISAALTANGTYYLAPDGTQSTSFVANGAEWQSSISVSLGGGGGGATRTIVATYAHQ